jgi:hypothetical protein
VNEELRAITRNQRNLESAVMMSSLMPSEKYSCSGSPLMFWNGSTAIEGLSGKARRDSFSGAARFGSRRVIRRHAIHAHGPPNVLQRLFADIEEGLPHPVAHLFVGRALEADGPGLAYSLQPGRDIEAVAHQVAVCFLYDVAQMHADAERDAPVRQDARVALDHGALDLDAQRTASTTL